MTTDSATYRLLTKQDAADTLAVSYRTIERLIEQRELKVVRVRGAVRIRPEDLDTYLLNQLTDEAPSSAPTPAKKPKTIKRRPVRSVAVPRRRVGRDIRERLV